MVPRAALRLLRASCRPRAPAPAPARPLAGLRWLSSPALRRSLEAQESRPPNVHNDNTREVEFGRSYENESITPEIIELGKEGNWPEALEKFRAQSEPDTILYNVIITAADRCGKYEEGLQLFAEMKSRDVRRTGVSYGGALTLLGRKGSYEQAADLWDEMREAGVQPTPACLTGVLNAFASRGDIAEVQRRIDEALHLGVEVFSSQLNCLLRACRELRAPERSLETLGRFGEYGLRPDTVSYTLAMGAAARAVHAGTMSFEEAQAYAAQLRESMREHIVSPQAFFVEEELSAILGIWPLRKVQHDTYVLQGLSQKDPMVRAAMAAIEASRNEGLRRTRLVETVENRLRRLPSGEAPSGEAATASGAEPAAAPPAAPLAPSLPQGWAEAADPNSGRSYYWQLADPQGTVTWQRPS